MAPLGREGGGGGVPGPHRGAERRGRVVDAAAMPDQAGHEVPPEHEGDGQRGDGERSEGAGREQGCGLERENEA